MPTQTITAVQTEDVRLPKDSGLYPRLLVAGNITSPQFQQARLYVQAITSRVKLGELEITVLNLNEIEWLYYRDWLQNVNPTINLENPAQFCM